MLSKHYPLLLLGQQRLKYLLAPASVEEKQRLQLSPPQGTPSLAMGMWSFHGVHPSARGAGWLWGARAPWEHLGVVVPGHAASVSGSASSLFSWLLSCSSPIRRRALFLPPCRPNATASPLKTSNSRGKPPVGRAGRALGASIASGPAPCPGGAGEPRLSPARCLLAPLPARRRQSRDRAIMKTSVGAEAGERGDALQMRSWGSRGGSFMYDHVYVSDRL